MLLGIVTGLALAAGAQAEFLSSFLPSHPANHAGPDKGQEDGTGATGISLLEVSEQWPIAHFDPVRANDIPGDGHGYGFWIFSHALFVWQCISTLTLSGLVKVLCVAGNVLVQVSPWPQVKRWENRGDTGGADSAPYVSIAFGGWQWCFYGILAWLVTGRSGFLILLQSNSLGAVLGTYYTYTFYRQCRSERARSSLIRYLSFVAGVVCFEACTTALLPTERALFLVGLISAFCGFVGALSVLVTVPTVIQTQDSKSIPGPVVAASSLTNLLWTLCGVLLNDQLITLPSLAGFVANSVCLFMKLTYASSEDGDAPTKETDLLPKEFICGSTGHCQDSADLSPDQARGRVPPTLRAQLRERMEQRWRQALLEKPLAKLSERTPLFKTCPAAPTSGASAWEKEIADTEEAVHEDTGGTG